MHINVAEFNSQPQCVPFATNAFARFMPGAAAGDGRAQFHARLVTKPRNGGCFLPIFALRPSRCATERMRCFSPSYFSRATVMPGQIAASWRPCEIVGFRRDLSLQGRVLQQRNDLRWGVGAGIVQDCLVELAADDVCRCAPAKEQLDDLFVPAPDGVGERSGLP